MSVDKSTKMLQVVVAVIIQDNKLLLTKRALHKVAGGAWEFPGGKIETDEQPLAALIRECKEELAIDVNSAEHLIVVKHQYPEFIVELDAYLITDFTGIPIAAEQQPLKWVDINQVHQYLTEDVDFAIFNAAILPRRYFITPNINHFDIRNHIEDPINRGFNLFQLRLPSATKQQYLALAHEITQFAESHPDKPKIMLKGDISILEEIPAAGLHLTSEQMYEFTTRPIQRDKLLAASIHNIGELEQAQKISVDFVTLSPIKKTLSHSDVKPLSSKDVAQIMQQAQIPVFWLGGMRNADLGNAIKNGAQGIAAMRGFDFS